MQRNFWDGMCLGTMIGVVLGIACTLWAGNFYARQVQAQQIEFLRKLTDKGVTVPTP